MKKIFLKRIVFGWILQIFLITFGVCENSYYKKICSIANKAFQNNKLNRALMLYKIALTKSREIDDRIGEINALEVIALIYYKKQHYLSANLYCQKAIQSGRLSYRPYYVLAQIAYEDGKSYEEALKYCQAGLYKFPNNLKLIRYYDWVADQQAIEIRQYTYSINFLNKLEQKIVDEMNLARRNPLAYVRYLEELKSYYIGDLLQLPGKIPIKTNEGIKAVDEAIHFLRSIKKMPTLKIVRGMCLAASDHVDDQGQKGVTGHLGNDGSKSHQRLERYGDWKGVSGENIAYGDNNAKMLVMQFIIDDGVADRGHRKNIFNPEYRVVGVATGMHAIYETMCVITYASAYNESNKLTSNSE